MASNNTKIAIIEDDLAISQMYRMKFEAAGYTVEVAENGQDGLELLKTYEADVVLLDMMMPIMNGEDMLKALRATDHGKTMKVLVLTNMGKEEASEDLRNNLGVLDYVVKAEMTPRQVEEHVKKYL